ncbi:MAG: hypothetical protein GY941_04830 [Planctomycetes bacterium]|nr:hypothetical protein [Planctomycetota bacterium]
MTQNSPWPEKYEKLFIQDGGYYEFAHFGWGSLQVQFAGYIMGYKNSADLLIENAINSKDISIIDTNVFPILFLYRQFIELSLKQAIIVLTDGNESKAKTISGLSHDLRKAWEKYSKIMNKSMNEKELKELEVVGKYIQEFHQIDKGSFNFRYPITKKLDLVFGSEKRINLRHLKSIMEKISNYFSGSLDYMYDQSSA